MADTTLQIKDAASANKALRVTDDGSGNLTPYHVEDTTQRSALLAKYDAIVTAVNATTTATQPVSGPLTSSQLTAAALATSAKQDAGNTSLASIATATAAGATASKQDTGNTSLASIVTSLAGTLAVTGPLTNAQLTAAGLATASNQSSANSSLSTIATNTTGLATASAQGTANTSLASIVTNTASNATSAKQDIGNASLSQIATNTSANATSARQDVMTAALATVGTRGYQAPISRLAVGSTSAQSAAITATEVLLHASTRMYVLVGTSPTATTDCIPLEQGEKFHLRISSGFKVAAIQDSAAGFLNIIPVA